MPDGILIRRATARDTETLARHRVSRFRDMKIVMPELSNALRGAAAAHIREAIDQGEYVTWVAHPSGEPDRIVGGAGVQLRRLLPRPDESGTRVLIGREGIVLTSTWNIITAGAEWRDASWR